MGQTFIIHGAKIPGTSTSPKRGRPGAILVGCTRANSKYWGGLLHDWDEWVDLHPLIKTRDFAGIPERRRDAWDWYQRQDARRPIWLQAPEDHRGTPLEQAQALERFNRVPGARRFPIEDVRRAFPVRERWGADLEPHRYYFCQVGIMVSWCLMRGATTIVLNGIGMPTNVPHQHLHRDIGYWIGFARGRGCDVVIDGPSTFLAPTHLYGYDRHHFKELTEARRQVEEGPEAVAELEARNAALRRRGRPPVTR